MSRKLIVEIIGDTSNLERSYRRASRSTGRFGADVGKATRGALAGSGAFRSLGRSVAFASTAFLGAAGLTGAVRAAFGEMADAQKVAAQTAAVLKSTSGIANVTAANVDTLATSLMNLSGVDDEVIKSSENLLLTFTNIRNFGGRGNNIFDQATKAALNLSVALDEDLQTAALQVGKALQDPVRGITALRRAGVSFTQSQQEQIKTLVESGRTLDAQKIILRELNREFGGRAAALGGTLAGKLNILRENVLNLGGAIAQELNPQIEKLVDRAIKWVQNADNQRRVMEQVRQVAGFLSDVFDRLRGAFEALNSITGSTRNSLKLLFSVFVAFKTLQLVSTLGQIASNIALIGTNATTSAGQVGGLKGALGRLGGIPPIVIPIVLGLAAAEAQKGLFGTDPQAQQQQLFNTLLKSGVPGDEALRILRGQAPAVTRRGVSPDDRRFSRALSGGGRGGVLPPPPRVDTTLSAAQRRAISLAGDASLGALRAQQQYDRAALAFLEKRFRAGRISAATYTKQAIALTNDLVQQTHAIGSILDEQAAAAKQAAEDAKRAAEERARFTVPLGLQLQEARAGARGRGLVPILRRMRQAALAALKSGRLSIEGQIDAWNEITSLNERIKDATSKATHDLTRRGRFQQRSPAFALAGGGGGVTITGDVHLHGVQNMRDFEDSVVKRSKARARNRRGAT